MLLSSRYVATGSVIIFMCSLLYLVFKNPFLNKNYTNVAKQQGIHIINLTDKMHVFHSTPHGHSGVVSDSKWYVYSNNHYSERICKQSYVPAKEIRSNNVTGEVCLIDKRLLLQHFPEKSHQFYNVSDHITELETVDLVRTLI